MHVFHIFTEARLLFSQNIYRQVFVHQKQHGIYIQRERERSIVSNIEYFKDQNAIIELNISIILLLSYV